MRCSTHHIPWFTTIFTQTTLLVMLFKNLLVLVLNITTSHCSLLFLATFYRNEHVLNVMRTIFYNNALLSSTVRRSPYCWLLSFSRTQVILKRLAFLVFSMITSVFSRPWHTTLCYVATYNNAIKKTRQLASFPLTHYYVSAVS